MNPSEPLLSLLHGAAAALRLQRHRYTLRSHGLAWSGFPGSLLHGGLGMMLARHAPQTFADLIGADGEPAPRGPRGWWLLPPLDHRMALAPGDDFSLDLFFANADPRWPADCAQALCALGQAGIGKTRGRFALERHEPVPWTPGTDPTPAPHPLADLLADAARPDSAPHLGVQLLTPLRIKVDAGLLREAPPAPLLLQRVLARAAMLANCRVMELPRAAQALAQAQSLRITQQSLNWDDLSRYSARQHAVMPLGGLTGWLRYSAPPDVPLDAVFAWLSVGEWLHAGTKTTFGLGAYRLAPGRIAPLPA